MIRSFRHKGLERFFTRSDRRRGIPPQLAPRIERILDRLDAAFHPEDMDLPSYRFHGLIGARQGEYSVRVSGNWRITFGFDGPDAENVDLEDYH